MKDESTSDMCLSSTLRNVFISKYSHKQIHCLFFFNFFYVCLWNCGRNVYQSLNRSSDLPAGSETVQQQFVVFFLSSLNSFEYLFEQTWEAFGGCSSAVRRFAAVFAALYHFKCYILRFWVVCRIKRNYLTRGNFTFKVDSLRFFFFFLMIKTWEDRNFLKEGSRRKPTWILDLNLRERSECKRMKRSPTSSQMWFRESSEGHFEGDTCLERGPAADRWDIILLWGLNETKTVFKGDKYSEWNWAKSPF